MELVLIALPLLALTYCNKQREKHHLPVAAATTLQEAFAELGKTFAAAHPGIQVDFTFGASGALARQIQEGKPPAVFASAAPEVMDALDQAGFLVAGSRAAFASNQIVLIQPQQGAPRLSGFLDLAQPTVSKIAMGNPQIVPIGQYTMEILQFFGIADVVQEKLVLAENVREVLSSVTRGEVAAGVVWLTDALTRPQDVHIVATAPPASHEPVKFQIAACQGTGQEAWAREFVALVLSPQGQAVLQKYGFQPVAAET